MATFTIPLDDKTTARLRVRAARYGRSMEEEAREILCSTLAGGQSRGGNLAERIQRRFADLGGVELELPRRTSLRRQP